MLLLYVSCGKEHTQHFACNLRKKLVFYLDDILPHYLNIIIFHEFREQNKKSREYSLHIHNRYRYTWNSRGARTMYL